MRRVRTVLFSLVILLVLVACSSGSGGTDDSGMSDTGGDAGSVEEAAHDGEVGTREVVTTGSLSLVVPDATRAMDEIVHLVEGVGGRVEERTEQTGETDDETYGWLTVRVPAAELTATVDRVKELGAASELSISSADVTRQGRDLDARITALQTSTDRLLALMSEADSSETLLAAEDALSERQAELEALQAERAHLSEQVAMSSLHISVSSEQTVQLEAGGFLGGLQDGWGALVSFASGLLVALGAVLPWLVFLGVPAAAVLVLVRRRRRRRTAGPAVPDATPA